MKWSEINEMYVQHHYAYERLDRNLAEQFLYCILKLQLIISGQEKHLTKTNSVLLKRQRNYAVIL